MEDDIIMIGQENPESTAGQLLVYYIEGIEKLLSIAGCGGKQLSKLHCMADKLMLLTEREIDIQLDFQEKFMREKAKEDAKETGVIKAFPSTVQ